MIPYQGNDLARGFFVSYTQVIFSVLNASSASEARKEEAQRLGDTGKLKINRKKKSFATIITAYDSYY
jgi:hypothetical protein